MTNPMCSICGEHANEHLAIAGHQFQSSPEPRPLKELLTKIRDAFEAERDSRKQWRGDDELGIDYKSPHVRDAWFNFRDGWLGAVSTHEPPAGPPWTFDRYQQGRLMAEGITINRETTFQAALLKAVRMADRLDVLVLRAAQPPAVDDTERLLYVMRMVSGNALRDAWIEYSAGDINSFRIAIDNARSRQTKSR